MILVISPAKALDFERPPTTEAFTEPDFLDEAEQLVGLLRQLSPVDVAKLMGLSDKLAALNVARYEAWSRPFSLANAKQAVLAFNGDVYGGLHASGFAEDDLAWAQRHLRILSGLYGLLRPLDLMQPYRLEMGSRLANASGRNLYAYWGTKLTLALKRLLENEREAGRAPVLVNAASREYFKSVRPAGLSGHVVTPVFEEWAAGRYRTISFHAKRARGLLCRFAILNRIDDAEDLKGFAGEGYAFAPYASDQDRFVFRRRTD